MRRANEPIAAAIAGLLLLACGTAAARDESTAETVRVGAGLAAIASAAYLGVGLLSREDESTRAVSAVGGAMAGAGLGFLVPALLLAGLEDRLDDTTLALIVVPVAVVTILGGAVAGAVVGYEATGAPAARVGAHLLVGGAVFIGLSLPFGALLAASDALAD